MKLKNVLPLETYTLTTGLSIPEVRQRIADSLEPKTSFILPMSNKDRVKPYEGQLAGDTFVINRIIDYKNSFLPIITGHLFTTQGQTQIAIRMGLAPLVLAFTIALLTLIGTICLGILLSGLLRFSQLFQPGFDWPVVIPFGMFLVLCLLTVIAFKVESKESKKFLAELLDGREQPS